MGGKSGFKHFKSERPGPFSQVRRFYNWYKDRLIGDIVDVEKPKPEPELPVYKGDPYFKVGPVRRLTKIEDEDEDTHYPEDGDDGMSFRNSSNLNVSSMSLPGFTRTRRDSQAASISSNLSYSNLPPAARPYKASWTSQNLDQLQDSDNPDTPLPVPPLPYGASKSATISPSTSMDEARESVAAATGSGRSPLRENFPFDNSNTTADAGSRSPSTSHLSPIPRTFDNPASGSPSPSISRASSPASGAVSPALSSERQRDANLPSGIKSKDDTSKDLPKTPEVLQSTDSKPS